MRPLILLTLPLLSLGACKWTEFDDLRDEAWVHATEKPDGSKSSNWGVAIVAGKRTSADGGRLAVFGSASSRLNEIGYDSNGNAKQLPEQNLGNIGIGNLSVEPIVLPDPEGNDFALVTQGSAQQVVVAAGGDSNLLQFIINGATAVDAAAYVRAPVIDSDDAHGARTPVGVAQPLVAANDTLFGTFFVNPDAPGAFLQPKCQITDGGTSIPIRGLGAVPAGDGTDDIAVWTANGTMLLLDGHLFNGERSGTTSPLCGGGVLDISTSPAVIKSSADVGFTPDLGSMSQIIRIDNRFALLQGHTASASFLAVWDFEGDTATNTAGVVVGTKIEEPGIRSVDLFRDDPSGADPTLHVVAGFPSAITDGVTAGKVQVYPVNTTSGFDGTVTELFTDSEPEDGQAFGRSVAVIQYNGLPTISVAGNNEVYTFFRTPTLYNTDRRNGR